MPDAVFLLPGVGAQGGRVEDLAAAFAPGPAGGLIAASRGIVRRARARRRGPRGRGAAARRRGCASWRGPGVSSAARALSDPAGSASRSDRVRFS